MGGWDKYRLSSWNATTHSSNHSNSFHLCSRRKKGLHLSLDLDINRFKAAIISVSFCTSLGFRGGCKLLMALIWSGFTSIPLWVTMYPKNFLELTPKEHLDAFKRSLCFLRISKIFARSSHMLEHHFALYNHVIDVNFNVLAQQWLEHFSYHPLVGWSCIIQAKRHHFVVIVSNWGNESCLFLIV